MLNSFLILLNIAAVVTVAGMLYAMHRDVLRARMQLDAATRAMQAELLAIRENQWQIHHHAADKLDEVRRMLERTPPAGLAINRSDILHVVDSFYQRKAA